MLRKVLISVTFLLLGIVIAAAWWRIDGDRTPEIELAEPAELPDPNAFDFLVKAADAVPDKGAVMDAVTGRRDSETGEWQEVSIEEKEQVVAENEETLTLVREALQYPLVFPDPDKIITGEEGIGIGGIRMLARIVSLESEVHRANGRYGPAMDAAVDCMKLGRITGNGSPLVGALTGIAIDGIALHRVPEILPELSDEKLEETARRLAGIRDKGFDLAGIIQAERAWGLSHFEYLFEEEDWRLEAARMDGVLSGVEMMKDHDELPVEQRLRVQLRGWLFHKGRMLAAFEDGVSQVEETIQLPYPEGKDLFPGPDRRIPSAMTGGLSEGFRTTWFQVLVRELTDEVLQAQIALKLWRREHGTHPERLEELGAYLQELPRDPFTAGDPLQYRPEGDSYVLYSIGQNGKNDGGEPMEEADKPEERRYRPQPHLPGDLVAGVNVLAPVEE